jgi:hypothetical protein
MKQSEDRKLLQINTKIIKVNMNYNNIYFDVNIHHIIYAASTVKNGSVHLPVETNRKARSPIVHIATAKPVQSAENCC